jgi:hypothetical protein
VNKVIKVAIGEYQSLSNVDMETNSWRKDAIRKNGWRSNGGGKTSDLGR